MKSKYLWLIIIIETLVLIAGGIFIARHLKCYHDQGKPRIYYYGPRGGKYYIDDLGKKVYVKDNTSFMREFRNEALITRGKPLSQCNLKFAENLSKNMAAQ